ncbi:hypothetical protein ACFQZC_01835 [Streptacidiphilus monticola]
MLHARQLPCGPTPVPPPSRPPPSAPPHRPRRSSCRTPAPPRTPCAASPPPRLHPLPDRDRPCGTRLDPASATDPGSWCVVDVAFTAGHEGITTGSLTADGTTVQLVGSTDPSAAAAATPRRTSPSTPP